MAVLLCLVFALGGAVVVAPSVAFAGGHGGGGKAKEGGAHGGKEEAKKEEGGGDDGISGGRFEGDPIYVRIAPLVLPVISDSGVQQIVTVIFEVQVKDMDTGQKMRTHMPRIMDALMRGLYGGLGEGDLRNGKMVSVVRVKGRALAAIREIMGQDGGIMDVLVQGVAQRML